MRRGTNDSSSGQLFEMSSRRSDTSGSYSEAIYAESASLAGSLPIETSVNVMAVGSPVIGG